MPRRRALRLLGTSLAAVMVPAVGPRMARAALSSHPECPGDSRLCSYEPEPGLTKWFCCPPPFNQWQCRAPGEREKKCHDPCTASGGAPCSSTKKDAGGHTKFECCARQFGEKCEDGACKGCPDSTTPCIPAKRGDRECCKRGTFCCFNNTSSACCGPKQKCNAARPGAAATCVCRSGAGSKCGSDCCGTGESCCGGRECCTKGQTCCGATCCDNGREWCLYKVEKTPGEELGVPQVCKKQCAPANRCGGNCCGTGYKCNKRKGRCVPA